MSDAFSGIGEIIKVEKYFRPKKTITNIAYDADYASGATIPDVNTINPALQKTERNAIISIIQLQLAISAADVGIGLCMKWISFNLSTYI